MSDTPTNPNDSDDAELLSIKHLEARMEIQTPFLPPQYLEQYEKIVAGSAKQMIDMVVAQQEFNMELKRQEIEINNRSLQRVIDVDNANIAEQKRASDIKTRGQLFSFLLSLCLIGLSAWFAYLGHTLLAGSAIALIIGVITVLFLQKQPKDTPPSQ